jgi:hypothetical protein
MIHKGVEFTVATTATPGVWKWQFRIGDDVKTGKTETRIHLLAIRRVQLRIDRELKKKKVRANELRSFYGYAGAKIENPFTNSAILAFARALAFPIVL